MKQAWRAASAVCLSLLVLASSANAGEVNDVSLATEVERYLDESAAAGGGSGGTLEVIFKDGIRFKADGIEIKLGGRLMFDTFFITSDDQPGVDTADGNFFRRVRFYMSGTVYNNTIFKVQIDFNTNARLRDVWVGLKNLWFVDKVIVGHVYEPMSLSEMTSSKYGTFIERASLFAPARNGGIRADGTAFDKRMTWSIGAFRTSSDTTAAARSDGGYSLTLRLTGLVVNNEENQTLVHIGFGFSMRADDTVQYRFRFGPATGDRSIDTGTITDADDTTIVNFELAFRFKSLHAQFEVFLVDVDSAAGGDPSFTGFYFQIGYFITGEVRPYKGNTWSRVRPKANFWDGGGGWGAWEIAFRFDTTDLTDGNIAGGEQTLLTFGVNWHWNPNTRVMMNIVFAEVEPVGSASVDITTLIIRWQYDF